MTEVIVILHNVRSSLNVGSIFRTSDGAGVRQVYLTGYTPTPIDRFGREEKMIAKTALGAQKSVSWKQRDVTETIQSLKNDSYNIIGVEQTSDSCDYKTFTPKEKTVYVFGNEVDGLEEEVIEMCDEVIEILLHGKKESLNVSVAVGVILFNF